MKVIISILFLANFAFAQAFDPKILKELETISLNDSKQRECAKSDYSLKILGDTSGTIIVNSKSKKLPTQRKYFIYEESADFILAENMSMMNLDYLKGSLTPSLVILKKPNKSLILEGLSLKFQKNGITENCLTGKESISNLHCLSKENGKANLRSYKGKITLEYKGKLIRDIASQYKKMNFSLAHSEFHSSKIRVARGGDLIRREVVLHDSDSTVNLTYTHKNTNLMISDCDLNL